MTAFADTRRGDNKMKQMTLEEISKAAASGAFRKIPVSREIYSDIRTPVETLKVLQGVSSHCYMLESVEDKKQWGRYTFLGYDPSLELTCVNGNLTITADAAEMKKVEDIPESHEEQLPTGQIRLTAKTAHPGAVIKTLIEKNKSPKIATLPTFTGGLVGYFSYDYIKYSEPILKLDAEDQEHFKDVDLMLFDKVIAYDNYRQKIVLMLNIETENLEENYEKAVQELEKMEELIRFGKPAETKAGHLKSEFRPLFNEKAYCEKVEQAFGNTDHNIAGLSGDALKDAVLMERKLELFGEGHTRYDMVRSAKFSEEALEVRNEMEALAIDLKTKGYYEFGNGNVLPAYIWTKQVEGATLTYDCTDKTDPVQFPGWRGVLDFAKLGLTVNGTTHNTAIKGLFEYIDPNGTIAAQLEQEGYVKTAWGSTLAENIDIYLSNILPGITSKESVPCYYWAIPYETISQSKGKVTNGYGLPQQ